MDFTDKRVLVTGGTRGIGRSVVEAFLGAGARVAVNGTTTATTAKAIAEMKAGARVIAAPGSVATADGCRAIVEAALEGLGGLDVLVNNAGIVTTDQALDRCSEAIWDSIIDTNLKGVFFTTRFAVSALRASKGNIINVASISGINGDLAFPVYGASKAAVIQLTKSHALELGPTVRVNAVCPGPIVTDMVRNAALNLFGGDVDSALQRWTDLMPGLKRLGQVHEIARPVLFLASDHASYMSGAVLVIDGGDSID